MDYRLDLEVIFDDKQCLGVNNETMVLSRISLVKTREGCCLKEVAMQVL